MVSKKCVACSAGTMNAADDDPDGDDTSCDTPEPTNSPTDSPTDAVSCY